jgi:hypothetical protein
LKVIGQFHVPAAFPLGKEPPVPFGQEVGWAPEPVWTILHTFIAFRVFRAKKRGHAEALWIRHYATSRKVAGSRPDEAN